MAFLKSKRILANLSEDFAVRALGSDSGRISDLISKALTTHKKWHQRDCPLKPNLMMWLVLFLSIYRGLSIPGVFRVLLSFLREEAPELDFKAVTPEALCHAKARLGSEPLKQLFSDLSYSTSSQIELYRGHRVVGLDGTHFRVADSTKNTKRFGKQEGINGSFAGYPHFLSAVLVETSTHKVIDIECGHCNSNERALAREVIKRTLGTGELAVVDRGVSSFGIFLEFNKVDCEFLARIPKRWNPKVMRTLGRGDCIVKIVPSKKERRRLKSLGENHNDGMTLRMLTYHIPGCGTIRLLTTLLDEKCYKASELASLYHQRWEAEITFDEIKIHFLGTLKGRQPTHFRSRTPDGVHQEVYGMLIAYNLIRELMNQAAQEHSLSPLQISFVETLAILKLWFPILERTRSPKLDFSRFLRDIAQCRLRERRPRSCPRKVKVLTGRYGTKHKCDREKQAPTSSTPVMGKSA